MVKLVTIETHDDQNRSYEKTEQPQTQPQPRL